MRARAAEEVRAICSSGITDLVLFSHEVGRFCAQREIPLTARGSATSTPAIWALGHADLCPLDYGLEGRMFVQDGRDDLPDLEVSSLHEAAVSAFVQQGGFDIRTPNETASFRACVRCVLASTSVWAPARRCGRQVPRWAWSLRE